MISAPIPLAKPSPPKLSEALEALQAIEQSGVFSNFGPVNTRFENALLEQVFGGVGKCLTVSNATTGLMLAIREAIERHPGKQRRFALMPSFTFAAAAQAAVWNGLTPLFCDIRSSDWTPDHHSELRLIEQFHDEIAVVVPYAKFGYDIDLSWYERVKREYNLPVVVDAAASLGTVSADGRGFGTGFSGTVVFSMHATKSFSTGEGGVIYSLDAERVATLRTMSSFGFGEPRHATMVGLNAKLSEISALLACLQLDKMEEVMDWRSELVAQHRQLLPRCVSLQPDRFTRQAHQFTSVLLPRHLSPRRDEIQAELDQRDVTSASYFSPHVAEQAYFRADGESLGRLPVTCDVASRILTLPLYDSMVIRDVAHVCSVFKAVLEQVEGRIEVASPCGNAGRETLLRHRMHHQRPPHPAAAQQRPGWLPAA